MMQVLFTSSPTIAQIPEQKNIQGTRISITFRNYEEEPK